MTLLLFSIYRHVINNVMTTRYITLSVGTSYVMTMSVTRMQIFSEISKNFNGDTIAFKGSYDNLTRLIISFLNVLNSPNK